MSTSDVLTVACAGCGNILLSSKEEMISWIEARSEGPSNSSQIDWHLLKKRFLSYKGWVEKSYPKGNILYCGVKCFLFSNSGALSEIFLGKQGWRREAR